MSSRKTWWFRKFNDRKGKDEWSIHGRAWKGEVQACLRCCSIGNQPEREPLVMPLAGSIIDSAVYTVSLYCKIYCKIAIQVMILYDVLV